MSNHINDTVTINNELNRDIFNEKNEIKTEIRVILLNVINYFFKNLEADLRISIEDITVTGSIVNYNYNKSSDIDLHLLIDYNKFEGETDIELLKEFLRTKASNFNNRISHLKLFGRTIELYFQDTTETHNSTGVYSLLKNKWLERPNKYDKSKVDMEGIKNGYKEYKNKVNQILASGEPKDIEIFFDQLKIYRKTGLDASGEMATANIVFKLLRNDGSIEKLKNKEVELNIK